MGWSEQDQGFNRREFIQAAAMASGALLVTNPGGALGGGTSFEISETKGKLDRAQGKTPLPNASWFVAENAGDGLVYRLPSGALGNAKYLTADLLTEGNDLTVFGIILQEGEDGPKFQCNFGVLPECSARFRLSLNALDQHRGVLDREGAFVKPQCYGEPVNPAGVDRITFSVVSKHPGPARWCMTALRSDAGAVNKIEKPVLPEGKLLDELGQSTLRAWPAKTHDAAEMKRRIQLQWENSAEQTWPAGFSRWGGWKTRKLTGGQGFFRTHYDGKRWWLADPDGYAFWSAGLDCVSVEQCLTAYAGLESALAWRPDAESDFRDAYDRVSHLDGSRLDETQERRTAHVNYLATNLIRALGADGWREKWARIAMSEMRRLRFNTVGNWSEWEYAKEAGFPYVRPMEFAVKRSGWIYRDFPDVYHPEFEADAAEFASVLSHTANDPALIGYFMMNEPQWGGSSTILPMEGVLYNTDSCFTRKELARFLKTRYPEESALAAKWKMPVTFSRLESGRWHGALSRESQDDLRDFSAVAAERYFAAISAACRKADPNHLNLGVRYNPVPPAWLVPAMACFDVFSINCYVTQVQHTEIKAICEGLNKPFMVGEFGFGALDVGLPATGPAPRLKDQLARGKEYRVFVEDAAADPYCVGTHWFQMYDQSALGRPDGECYNLGLVDVCNQTYAEMDRATTATNEQIYEVADKQTAAFADVPDYLSTVSM